MTKYPKVTIAIPTFNRSKYLQEAIESGLSQDYPNIEILVSDNASEDGTESLMKEYILKSSRIKYYRNEKNLGAYENWRSCLDRATGEYCLILSDDDLLLERAISKLVLAMQDGVSIVIGNLLYIDDIGKVCGKHKNPPGKLNMEQFWEARLSKGYHDTPSAVMYRTMEARKLFRFIPKDNSAMDLALDLMLSEKGDVVCYNEDVVKYRIHIGNDSNNVYRCASSHITLYDFFVNRGYDIRMLNLLKNFCRDTIFSYVLFHAILKKSDFRLVKKCMGLLLNKLVKSEFEAYLYFFKYVVIGCWRRLKRVCRLERM